MRLSTRKVLDKSFSSLGIMTIFLMAAALLVILVPIFIKGAGAVVFKATVEHRRLMVEQFNRGDTEQLKNELLEVEKARKPVFDMIKDFEEKAACSLDPAVVILEEINARGDSLGNRVGRRLEKFKEADTLEEKSDAILKSYDLIINSQHVEELKAQAERLKSVYDTAALRFKAFSELNDSLHELLGPFPGEQTAVLPRKQYGQTRWDRSKVKLNEIIYKEEWDYSDGLAMGRRIEKPRVDIFKDTELEPLFGYIEKNIESIMRPKLTFYGGFFTDSSLDSHFFGGIMPELLGTLYLTVGAMLFALPIGVIAAIFFTEYAGENFVVDLLRTCVSTLAGVPSIVFGLFGLAFFLTGLQMPKSVLAGSLTLALLILPTVIRASEEAIRAVPQTYREAALALGAGKWHTVMSVILPAALPGILTGVVISMGRAAGETAPIIFTAAVSVGRALSPVDAFSQPTPALSWNIYNLCSEHEAVDEIRHVQFGMVACLVLVVILLNAAAIYLRARISRKLKG